MKISREVRFAVWFALVLTLVFVGVFTQRAGLLLLGGILYGISLWLYYAEAVRKRTMREWMLRVLVVGCIFPVYYLVLRQHANHVGMFKTHTIFEMNHTIEHNSHNSTGNTQLQPQAPRTRLTETRLGSPEMLRADLDSLVDKIRSVTPSTIGLDGVSAKQQAIIINGTLYTEPGKQDVARLQYYVNVLKELPGVSGVDIDNIRRVSENGVVATKFTVSVWMGTRRGRSPTTTPDMRISTLLNLFKQVAREEGVELLSIEPHPFVSIDTESRIRSVDVYLQLREERRPPTYIKHVEAVTQCHTDADAILDSRFHSRDVPVSMVFNCELSE